MNFQLTRQTRKPASGEKSHLRAPLSLTLPAQEGLDWMYECFGNGDARATHCICGRMLPARQEFQQTAL